MASEADETEDVPLPLGLVPPPAIFAQPPAVGEGAGSPAAAAAFSAASLCALVRSASSFWISRMDRCPAENTQPLTKAAKLKWHRLASQERLEGISCPWEKIQSAGSTQAGMRSVKHA